MATMQVQVVSPERELFSGDAHEVYARSLDGEIGILPGHQPALLALDIAPVRIRTADGAQEVVAVHHGFLYFRHNRLVVLADLAELASDIDQRRAQQDRERIAGELRDGDDEELRRRLRSAELRVELASGTR